MELEKELVARIFLHKVAIVRSAIVYNYIKREKEKGGIQLSDIFIEQHALEQANHKVQELLCTGKINEAYEQAWDTVKHKIPDTFNIMGNLVS